MAVPSSRHRANANRWNAIAKQREEANKPQEIKEEVVSPEEEKKRIEMLKSLGLLKE